MMVYIIVLLLCIIVFLYLKLQSKNFDEQIFYKDQQTLLKEQEGLEQALVKIQTQKLLSEKMNIEIAKKLEQAQQRCGLKTFLSGEDFVEWLRKLENAAKSQGEYQSCVKSQQPNFTKAEELKQILLECRAILPFYNGDSTDFYALVSAAEEKCEIITSLKKDIKNKQQQQEELQAEKQQSEQSLREKQEQKQAAEADLQALLQTYFKGQIRTISQDKMSTLSELISDKIHAKLSLEKIKTLEAELAEFQNLDPDFPQEKNALDLALNQQKSKMDILGGHYRQAIERKTKAKDALQQITGKDEIAQLEQQKQILLLTIQKEAENYLRLKFGLALANAALSAYRKKYRGSMMEVTEHAFVTLTQGAYQSIQTQVGNDKEFLQAITANGVTKRVEDMSKGTRFQLYMALRVAAYEQLLSKNINMPFFCDDIFETFDEERTKAACRLMQYIGQKGQAIYFTHHQHVADIAKEVCNHEVKIHNIGQ